MVEFHLFPFVDHIMIKWLKRNQNKNEPEIIPNDVIQVSDEQPKEGVFARFKRGLSKTRHQLGEGIGHLLLGKKIIDADLLDDLEALLLKADLGLETTKTILDQLHMDLDRKQLTDGDAVYTALQARLQAIISQQSQPLNITKKNAVPFVILMVGINGAGKTTTIGKLAKQYQQQGKKVMLAAGDTFRAAAVEQLQVWGERNQVPVIAQHTGADSASVIYDALQAAIARDVDVLIADTAGRLHTQHNLMEELKKIKRVLQKISPDTPHETMLVLDASIGQNAINQARQFNESIGLTGITMTKLDGTAKGGILFAIAHELEIPFRYLGIGEGIDDLRAFDPSHFVKAIFDDDRI